MRTTNDFVGTTKSQSNLATFSLKKLWVDILSINTITCWDSMVAITHMVCGDVQPASACIEIYGLGWSPRVSSIYSSSSSTSYSLVWLLLWHSGRSSRGPWHLWLGVNLSLHLKQSPCALHFYISFQLNRLGVAIGVDRFTRTMVVDTRFYNGGCMNLFVLVICPSFILARLMASFNVLGLNIRIPLAISYFNPPIKVPTRAFCVQPWTRLPSLSNSFW